MKIRYQRHTLDRREVALPMPDLSRDIDAMVRRIRQRNGLVRQAELDAFVRVHGSVAAYWLGRAVAAAKLDVDDPPRKRDARARSRTR